MGWIESTARVALLLFGSGACSLVYETVWLRELRLVFGASTMASAAVVALFVGGLGAGGVIFGARADRSARPLAMYGNLEAGIAASSAVTPLLLALVRAAYVALGGTRALGSGGGTVVRLLLAALVFAVPTLLMGGTLPAVARAVEREDDRGRRDLALLYGVNTLGAVTGCMASTFVAFEVFGTRLTLWIACLVNALVAIAARNLARSTPPPAAREAIAKDAAPLRREAPAWLVLTAAGVAGFVFCLMELVWYRMLGPLLGGTVFTFGLILAIALLGIGLGGVACGLRPRSRAATIRGFAWTCLLEAAFVALPIAMGDRLAVVAAVLRPMGGLSFALDVASWAAITGVVVFPAAFMSGVQLPLLVALLGEGGDDVGRDVGRTYATNTLGAIVGSLAGGFGLIPALGAVGCWRASAWLLVALGAVAIAIDARKRPLAAIAPALAGLAAIACARATGPTPAWRHSPIGAGRVSTTRLRTPDAVRAWEHERRRAIAWEADGRESSVAIDQGEGIAFIVNGKNDGNARTDAATGLMLGLAGAILHPHPTRAMVIGLGTGESAGWLAAVDTITDVDVAELEPAILEVARRCDAVNHAALANPKLHVEIGDARELLLTSKRKYDLVASEPSNPYRAGVASLFTREYYEAIASRLEEGGLFLQWVQGYEIDGRTMRTIYATLATVFPEIETWELGSGDLLLVGSMRPVAHDVARLRARVTEEPYRSALAYGWRASDAEGVLAHYVAGAGLARAVAALEGDATNTDDRNLVEMGFARSVGSGMRGFTVDDVRRLARARGEGRPAVTGGDVGWDRVEDGLASFYLAEGAPPAEVRDLSPDRAHRLAALRAFAAGDAARAASEWRAQTRDPIDPTEIAAVASALTDVGDAEGPALAERLFDPAERDAIVARWRARHGDPEGAVASLESLFVRMRTDAWPLSSLVAFAFEEAKALAQDARFAPRLYAALREPFAVHVANEARLDTARVVALKAGACVDAFGAYEPNVPWSEPILLERLGCYRAASDPRADRAAEDLLTWRRERPAPFAIGLEPAR